MDFKEGSISLLTAPRPLCHVVNLPNNVVIWLSTDRLVSDNILRKHTVRCIHHLEVTSESPYQS
jgi:hypothetical protein